MARKLLALLLLILTTPAFAGHITASGSVSDYLYVPMPQTPGNYLLRYQFDKAVTFAAGYYSYETFNQYDPYTGEWRGGDDMDGPNEQFVNDPTSHGVLTWPLYGNYDYFDGVFHVIGKRSYSGYWFRFNGNPGPVAYHVDLFSPVPEPVEWALLITGFGLAGAALRRRSARITPLAA